MMIIELGHETSWQVGAWSEAERLLCQLPTYYPLTRCGRCPATSSLAFTLIDSTTDALTDSLTRSY